MSNQQPILTISQPTEGDWQPVIVYGLELPNSNYIAVNNGTSKVIAVCGGAGAADEQESIANAYLIAASKDMLVALEGLLAETDELNYPARVAAAEAAIKKARGLGR